VNTTANQFLRKILTFLTFAFITCLFMTSGTRAEGEPSTIIPSDGTRLGVAGSGTEFNSPQSFNRLYLPAGSSATLTLHKPSSSGSLSIFNVMRLIGGNCRTAGMNTRNSPGNGDQLVTPNIAGDTITGIYGGVTTTFDVYCIQVSTAHSGDVSFYISTSAGILGNQRSSSSGTGYVHDDSPFSGGGTWTKTIQFGTPCNVNPGDVNNTIYLYDLDIGRAWGSGSQGVITATIEKRSLITGAVEMIALSGDINAAGQITRPGENEDFDIYPTEGFLEAHAYTLRLSNINDVNAIKIGLPSDQIYAAFTCEGIELATCSVSGGSVNVPSGTNFTRQITHIVPASVRLPAGSQATGLHYAITTNGVPASWNATSGFTTPPDISFPPPDKQALLVPQNRTPSNATYYEFVWGDGFTYRRFYVNNPSTVSSDITVQAPNVTTLTTYTMVVRMLDRSGGRWLPNYCTLRVTVTPAVPEVSCEFVTPAETKGLGDAYYPVVRVTSADVAGAPSISATVNFSINTVPATSRSVASTSAIVEGSDATFGLQAPPPAATVSYPASGGPIIMSARGDFIASASASWSASFGSYSGVELCEGSVAAQGTEVGVVGRPYFKVRGGDLVSYGTSVRGFNQYGRTFDPVSGCTGAVVGRCGAGVEGGIQANGSVGGVASGYRGTQSPALKSRTIANTLGGAFGAWGGGYAGIVPAAPDYEIPSTATSFPGFGAVAPNTIREFVGMATLSSGVVPSGARITVYVDGDVRITGSGITYATAAGYTDRTAIPHFRLIAKGNIYIESSVAQLDGEYIAEGLVYTCHNSGWNTPINNANIMDPCDNTNLVVNGALIGDSIKLTRTGGHDRYATEADAVYSGGYINAANIAEIIQFTPELFLARPATSPTNYPVSGKYNSITALPPLF
jgi:hypothetical protein